MKNKLVGWDDGRLYFYDKDEKEFCVNDYPKLFEQSKRLIKHTLRISCW